MLCPSFTLRNWEIWACDLVVLRWLDSWWAVSVFVIPCSFTMILLSSDFLKNYYSVKPLWIKKWRYIPKKPGQRCLWTEAWQPRQKAHGLLLGTVFPELLGSAVWTGWGTWWSRSWIVFCKSFFGGASLMLLLISASHSGCLKGGLEQSPSRNSWTAVLWRWPLRQ